MDTENGLFNLYKEFILQNSAYKPLIFNDTPNQLAQFPTITFIESDNRDSSDGNSIDRNEFVDILQYKIDIYTKNQTNGNQLIARKIVTTELKDLTINKAEFLDINVDRTVIVAECELNNWNGKIR